MADFTPKEMELVPLRVIPEERIDAAYDDTPHLEPPGFITVGCNECATAEIEIKASISDPVMLKSTNRPYRNRIPISLRFRGTPMCETAFEITPTLLRRADVPGNDVCALCGQTFETHDARWRVTAKDQGHEFRPPSRPDYVSTVHIECACALAEAAIAEAIGGYDTYRAQQFDSEIEAA